MSSEPPPAPVPPVHVQVPPVPVTEAHVVVSPPATEMVDARVSAPPDPVLQPVTNTDTTKLAAPLPSARRVPTETRIDVVAHRQPTAPLNTNETSEDEPLDQLMHEIIEEEGGVLVKPEEEEVTGAEQVAVETVPQQFLKTDPSFGLSAAQVSERKKKFGPNQLTEERENLVLKFLMFFLGPIQVSNCLSPNYIFMS